MGPPLFAVEPTPTVASRLSIPCQTRLVTGHRWRYAWDYPMESGLVVAVPEAEPRVGPVRERFDAYSRIGVPAHVTVLYPFFEAEALTDEVIGEITEAVSGIASFDFELARVASFDDSAYYLAPEPAEPFRTLTTVLWEAFPSFPPFGGKFDTVIPHMTLGSSDEGASAELVIGLLGVHLPIRARAKEITLLAEEIDGWIVRQVFPLR